MFNKIPWVFNHQKNSLLWDFRNPLGARVAPKCTNQSLARWNSKTPKGKGFTQVYISGQKIAQLVLENPVSEFVK